MISILRKLIPVDPIASDAKKKLLKEGSNFVLHSKMLCESRPVGKYGCDFIHNRFLLEKAQGSGFANLFDEWYNRSGKIRFVIDPNSRPNMILIELILLRNLLIDSSRTSATT